MAENDFSIDKDRKIREILASHRRAHEEQNIDLFINEIKFSLGIFHSSDYPELHKKAMNELKNIRDQCAKLAAFFSQDYENILIPEAYSLFEIERNADEHDSKQLADLLGRVVANINGFAGNEIPKTKPKDFAPRKIEDSLIRAYKKHLKRSPILSETSDDLEVFRIVFSLIGRSPEDPLKTAKMAKKRAG